LYKSKGALEMAYVDGIEKSLKPLFKDLPAMPKGGKDWFVKALPFLAIIGGILEIWAAWSLWHLGHVVNVYINYAYSTSATLGGGVIVHSLGFFYWLSLVTVAIDGVLLLLAFSGLKAKSKSGWDLLFLVGLINVAYGIFSIFDSYYGGIGNLIGSLVGSAIGFYILFQVLPYYSAKTAKQTT